MLLTWFAFVVIVGQRGVAMLADARRALDQSGIPVTRRGLPRELDVQPKMAKAMLRLRLDDQQKERA